MSNGIYFKKKGGGGIFVTFISRQSRRELGRDIYVLGVPPFLKDCRLHRVGFEFSPVNRSSPFL